MIKKKAYLLIFLFVAQLATFAQTQTFDLVTYAPPKGWKKELTQNAVSYTYINKADKSWCQINIYKSTASKGNIDADFESEWESLVKKQYNTTDTPATNIQRTEGWDIKSGAGKFIFNKKATAALLTTFSGNGTCFSIVSITLGDRYIKNIEELMASLDLKIPAARINKEQTNRTDNKVLPVSNEFTFSTTNFDDGWKSEAKNDFAEVSKGNVKVLVHYPDKTADDYIPELKAGDYRAWNILVAPKYRNLKNLEWKTIQSYESITYMEGDATENASGKNVHIVFFKKHFYKGNGRYIEFVAANKSQIEAEFGTYHNDTKGWDKMANMQFRNKYAVGANDLIGNWNANAYESLTYYYIATGKNAGTTATSTADEFTFLTGNNYQSTHTGASGMVGNMKFSSVTYKGKSTVTNWNITLTDRFKGATEKYDCYFEAVKGGRILMLTDRLGTTFSLAKSK